jgi:hypothetical protein
MAAPLSMTPISCALVINNGLLASWETAKFYLGHGRAFNSAQAMGQGNAQGRYLQTLGFIGAHKKTAAGLSQRRLMWTCPNAQAAIQLLMNS